MSNPGVIKLASLNDNEHIAFPYRFEIEDNIGEAIHIHYKDIRLDLTIREFIELADKIEDICGELVDIEGFTIEGFDPLHLMGFATELANIDRFELCDIYLGVLLVDTYSEDGKEKFAPLKESRVYKSLNGVTAEDDARSQINYFAKGDSSKGTNEERIKYCISRIECDGYPYDEQYILVDENNRIIDGQHRAACLYYLYGNKEVKVKRAIRFEKESTVAEENVLQGNSETNNGSGVKRMLKSIIKHVLWRTWHSEDLGEQMIINRLDDEQKRIEQLEKSIKSIEQTTEQMNSSVNKMLFR